MWGTPVGDEFRNWIDKWDNVCLNEKRHNNIMILVDGQNFVFFFEHDDNVFACHEQDRVMFARMKAKDDDDKELDLKKGTFMAFNLTKSLSGKPEKAIFYMEDIPDIDILTKDKAKDSLVQQAEKIEPERIASGAKGIMAAIQMARSSAPATGKPDELPQAHAQPQAQVSQDSKR